MLAPNRFLLSVCLRRAGGEHRAGARLFALLPTVIAYLLYYRGIQKIRDSSRVPVQASVECVVAVGIGVLALHETLGTVKLLGIARVLGSVLLMNSGTQKTACS